MSVCSRATTRYELYTTTTPSHSYLYATTLPFLGHTLATLPQNMHKPSTTKSSYASHLRYSKQPTTTESRESTIFLFAKKPEIQRTKRLLTSGPPQTVARSRRAYHGYHTKKQSLSINAMPVNKDTELAKSAIKQVTRGSQVSQHQVEYPSIHFRVVSV